MTVAFLKPKYPSLLFVLQLLTGFFLLDCLELQVTIVYRKADCLLVFKGILFYYNPMAKLTCAFAGKFQRACLNLIFVFLLVFPSADCLTVFFWLPPLKL